jgi:hypothetical protein
MRKEAGPNPRSAPLDGRATAAGSTGVLFFRVNGMLLDSIRDPII